MGGQVLKCQLLGIMLLDISENLMEQISGLGFSGNQGALVQKPGPDIIQVSFCVQRL